MTDATHHRKVEIVWLEGKSSVQHSHSHLPSWVWERMHLAREAEDNCTVGEVAQRWAEVDNQPDYKAQRLAP